MVDKDTRDTRGHDDSTALKAGSRDHPARGTRPAISPLRLQLLMRDVTKHQSRQDECSEQDDREHCFPLESRTITSCHTDVLVKILGTFRVKRMQHRFSAWLLQFGLTRRLGRSILSSIREY
jgi:hypothetical protein